MRKITDKTFDAERALYSETDLLVTNCIFDGPSDGESAFKECRNLQVENCHFHLRYPFWHDDGLTIKDCVMHETCRAPLWYSEHINICNSKIVGVKAIRECSDVILNNCDVTSSEFGWSVDGMTVKNCRFDGEYMLMRSCDLHFSDFEMRGKYSFQYIRDASFENCNFDTKDAFWHAENIYVRNCTVKGEYLAWYSENIVFENCTIIGTQPFCYCKGLKLINCKMRDCDLAFEKSEVDAVLTEPIDSIKNPLSGTINVPRAGEVIFNESWAKGQIIFEKK